MSAAKWHREQAQNARNSGAKFPPESNPARRYVEIASHHAAAADALEALAVPGVAGLLARLSRGETDDFRTGEEERASLATLARIAKEASRG